MDDLIKQMFQQAPCVVALLYLLFKSDKRVDDMVKLLSSMVKPQEKRDLGTDTPKSE
jgi:hypothetical protein